MLLLSIHNEHSLQLRHTIGLWFSPGPPVSSTNKTDLHDITKILLKMALNTIKLNLSKLHHECLKRI